MLQNLGLLISLLFLLVIVGGGWGRTVANVTSSKTMQAIAFWSILFGMMIPTLTSSVAIAVNAHVKLAWIGTLVIAVAGWACSPRSRVSTRNPRATRPLLIQMGFGVAIVFFLCGFSAENGTYGGQPLRIGPDAVGNATAISGLAKGDSLNSIVHDLKISMANQNLEEILDPQTRDLYRVPSIQTQIKTEFLVAGLRWGFSGTGGMLTWLLGLTNLWLLLNALGNIALVCVALGIWVVVHPLQLPMASKFLAVLSGTLSPMLLNGYREGGVAQVWVVPTSLALLLILGSQNTRLKPSMMIIGPILATSAVAYSDLFILQCGVLVIYLVLSLSRDSLKLESYKVIGGIVVACLMAPQFFQRLISYIPRRLSDAGIGGWSMPHWTNISESVGLLNRFNQIAPKGLQFRDSVGAANAILFDLILLALAVSTFQLGRKEKDVRFPIAALIVVLAVRFKSQVVDDVSNYQYFKAFGTLMPIISIGLVITCFSHTEEKHKIHNWLRVALSWVFCASMIISTLDYARTFRQQATFLPHEYQTDEFIETVRKLDSVNYFAALNIQMASLATYTSGSWLGRGTYQLKENLLAVRDRPVYVLISESQCGPNWSCVKDIERGDILFQTYSLTAYRISDDTKFLVNENSDNDWAVRASAASVAAGGPKLNWSYIPS